MPSTLFSGIPNSMEFAFKVARKVRGIPDEVTNEDALTQAMIDPNTIAVILQIVQEVMKCLNNSRGPAFKRVMGNLAAKPIDKLPDQMRVNGLINLWANALALPREPGDVVMIREAMAELAGDLDEKKFGAIQTEMIWMTI